MSLVTTDVHNDAARPSNTRTFDSQSQLSSSATTIGHMTAQLANTVAHHSPATTEGSYLFIYFFVFEPNLASNIVVNSHSLISDSVTVYWICALLFLVLRSRFMCFQAFTFGRAPAGCCRASNFGW